MKIYLTDVGQALLYKAQGGKVLKFTRFGLGDGELNGQAIQKLTTLLNEKMSSVISKLNVKNNKVTVGLTFDNSDLLEGFYFRELGLFAEDPDTKEEILYMYGNSGDTSDYIDANTSKAIEENLDVEIIISDVENITATIEGSLVYLTLNGDASNTTVTFTESEEKTDIESGDTLSGLFGKIKKWFSSFAKVAFSGSYNDLKDVVEEVFIATYNVTTYAEIQNAVNTGKVILLDYGGTHRLQLTFISAEQFNFAGYVDAGTILYNAICKSTNEWTLEAKDNTIPQISYSTEELEPGVSPLATGQIHLTYE